MKLVAVHEFMCPCCGYINKIEDNRLGDKYKEQAIRCASCKGSLEIIVADGVDDDVNLIVTSLQNTPTR